jgi:uncharacterized tellurite resistance protein B-like protein|tara:strand:- start:38 stop:466 length:429 start_codon:yes stop_codon:yes gene_type:complete
MFNFLKTKKTNVNENNSLLSKTASLLIHVAKIDEKYTNKEKDIIKKTLIKLGAEKSTIDQLILNAEINESKSNQLLDFTKEVKNTSDEFKIKIIEALWTVIYSDAEADMYEANLMRRLSGLLYLDNKIMGNIKERIKKNLPK